MSNDCAELDLNSYGRTLLRSSAHILFGSLILTAAVIWFAQRPNPMASLSLQVIGVSDDYQVSAEREGAEFESPVYHEAVAKAVKRKLGDAALPKVTTKRDSPFVGLLTTPNCWWAECVHMQSVHAHLHQWSGLCPSL